VILVVCGTERFGFERMVRQCDRIVPTEHGGLAQLGSTSYRPSRLRFTDYVAFVEMRRLIRQASGIVMHAGAGSLLTCLQEERLPVLVPRQAAFGEHVDDHQMEFAARVEREYGIPVCWEVEQLGFACVLAAGARRLVRAPSSALCEHLDRALQRGIDALAARKAGGRGRPRAADAVESRERARYGW
jgi:UDP-N-acetylglucosamine transferase subunit ALG13